MSNKENDTGMSLGVLAIAAGLLLLSIFFKGIVFSLSIRTYAAEVICLLLINIYGGYRLLKGALQSKWKHFKMKPIFLSLLASGCFGLAFGITYGVRMAFSYPDRIFGVYSLIEIMVISFFPTVTMFVFLGLIYPRMKEKKELKNKQMKIDDVKEND